MITSQNNLIGRISAKQNISGKLNNAIVKVYPELEDLTVTPSAEEQHFKSEKYGYDNVIVKAVESEELNIVPGTEEQIKEGMFNKVTVAGDSNLLPENIKEGIEIFEVTGTAELSGGENAVIDTTKLTTNTNVKIQSYILNQMLTKIPHIDVSEWISTAYMFYNCNNLTNLDVSNFNTSKVTNMSDMFSGCQSLMSLDVSNFDTSKVTNMSYMFYNCNNLTNLDVSNFDTSKVTDMSFMFSNCHNLENLNLSSFDLRNVININVFITSSNLTNLKFGYNLGKGYTKKSTNYGNYILNLAPCKLLTHESLMSVINNLYDLNLTYNVANGGTLYTQSLKLGATNLAKLTAEEIAIATNKRLDGFIERRTKMQFFDYTNPKMMVAEKGKHIRAKNDVYVAEHIDENGLLVEEHVPYYSTTLFVPDSFTEAQMNELYVEEDI